MFKLMARVLLIVSVLMWGTFSFAAVAEKIIQSGSLPMSINVLIDMDQWKIADQQSQGEVVQMTEIVPKNENIENWNNLITLMSMKGKEKSVDEIRDIMVNDLLRKQCSDTKSDLLSKDNKDDITFYFTVQNCGTGVKADQYVVVRLVQNQYGTHTIQYATKSANPSPEKRQEMLDFVKSAKVVVQQ